MNRIPKQFMYTHLHKITPITLYTRNNIINRTDSQRIYEYLKYVIISSFLIKYIIYHKYIKLIIYIFVVIKLGITISVLNNLLI